MADDHKKDENTTKSTTTSATGKSVSRHKSISVGTESSGTKSSSLTTKSKMQSRVANVTDDKGTTKTQQADEDQAGKKPTIRMLFHRAKEVLHMTEKTEYPKQLKEAFDEYDEYKESIQNVVYQLTDLVRPDKKVVKTDNSMEFEPPEKEDDYEIAAELLKKDDFKDYQKYDNMVKSLELLSKEHRQYLKKSRKCLHNIRTFLRHDYLLMENKRNTLEEKRMDMDLAKNEVRSAKDPSIVEMKEKTLKTSTEEYKAIYNEVVEEMEKFPKKKEAHVQDLVDWSKAHIRFHENALKILEKNDLNTPIKNGWAEFRNPHFF